MKTESEYKAEFAKQFLKTSKTKEDAFRILNQLVPDATKWTLWASENWPKDPEVLAIMNAEIAEQGELAFLPGKAELARKIWDKLNDKFCFQPEDFVKVGKLYADVMGMIEKPQTSVTANVNVSNRVMVVKDQGTDKDWEAKARAQQKKLVESQ